MTALVKSAFISVVYDSHFAVVDDRFPCTLCSYPFPFAIQGLHCLSFYDMRRQSVHCAECYNKGSGDCRDVM